MVTVKEVFDKAYGKVPEGATIHTAIDWENFENKNFRYGVQLAGSTPRDCLCYWEPDDEEWVEYDLLMETSPDISNRDGWAFRGFFSKAYDEALCELTGNPPLAFF
jgi:hypothetical protein